MYFQSCDKMTQSISDISEDALRYIFSMLDSSTLAQCKVVCGHWYNLISGLEESQLFWRRLVLQEVGVNIASELAGKIPIDTSERHTFDWRSAFTKYKLAFCTNKHAPVRRDLNITRDLYIPSICLVDFRGGTGFVTGHRNGHCILWSDDECDKFHLVMNYHIRRPGDINFIEVLNFSDGEKHCEVVVATSRVITRLVDLNDPYNAICTEVFSTGNNIKCIRTFGSHILVLQENGLINILKCSVDSNCQLNVEHLFSPSVGLPGSVDNFTKWATIWNGKIYCVGWSLSRKIYDINEKVWSDVLSPVLFHYEDLTLPTEILFNEIRCFLFRNGITLVVSENILMISIDGENFTKIECLRYFGGTVTAVDIHSGILALGTCTGNLYVYAFHKDEELMVLNLTTPTYFQQIFLSPIMSVFIKESDLREIFLKVISHDKIRELRWNSKGKRNSEKTFDFKSHISSQVDFHL